MESEDLLKKGLKNTFKPLALFMNIPIPQVTILVWMISTEWEGNHRTSLEL